jgi:hypothetical protein
LTLSKGNDILGITIL